jgi:hypothetical protein
MSYRPLLQDPDIYAEMNNGRILTISIWGAHHFGGARPRRLPVGVGCTCWVDDGGRFRAYRKRITPFARFRPSVAWSDGMTGLPDQSILIKTHAALRHYRAAVTDRDGIVAPDRVFAVADFRRRLDRIRRHGFSSGSRRGDAPWPPDWLQDARRANRFLPRAAGQCLMPEMQRGVMAVSEKADLGLDGLRLLSQPLYRTDQFVLVQPRWWRPMPLLLPRAGQAGRRTGASIWSLGLPIAAIFIAVTAPSWRSPITQGERDALDRRVFFGHLLVAIAGPTPDGNNAILVVFYIGFSQLNPR